MIIIIGAHSSSGKTLMAQTLMEKYKIPVYSIDRLKMEIYRSDENCGFTPTDSNDLIGTKLWPMIKKTIMTSIENNQDLIIEGCYVYPHNIKELDARYSQYLIPIFFGFSRKYIEDKFEVNILEYRNVVKNRGYPEERSKQNFVDEHALFKSRCKINDMKFFEINDNYDDEISIIYDYIDKEINRVRSFPIIGRRLSD